MQGTKERSRADAKFYKFDQDDSAWIEFNVSHSLLGQKLFLGYHLVYQGAFKR